MLLIVGLGNPGDQYASSRHNMGFMTLDYLMEERVGEEINKKGFHGLYTKAMFCGEQVLFLKPQTYMNLSGQSVVEAMHFFKIKAEDIIVIYDDMDLDVGKIRLRPNGSSGGQKGMGNIRKQYWQNGLSQNYIPYFQEGRRCTRSFNSCIVHTLPPHPNILPCLHCILAIY